MKYTLISFGICYLSILFYKLKLKTICTHAFGCKSIEINGLQRCENIFIFIRLLDGTLISAIFENGKDYINYPKSLNEIVIVYNKLIEQGWKELSSLEITNISGVKINYFTKINRL